MRRPLVSPMYSWSILCAAMLCTTASAQPVSLEGFGQVSLYTAIAHYEYSGDGVPVLGLITQRMPNDKVRFTMCDNKTIELEFRQLKASTARCDARPKDPGSWKTTSRVIQPFFKVADAGVGPVVIFEGKTMKLVALPEPYKGTLMKAKVGDTVGYAFTDEQGKKSLAILETPSRGTKQ